MPGRKPVIRKSPAKTSPKPAAGVRLGRCASGNCACKRLRPDGSHSYPYSLSQAEGLSRAAAQAQVRPRDLFFRRGARPAGTGRPGKTEEEPGLESRAHAARSVHGHEPGRRGSHGPVRDPGAFPPAPERGRNPEAARGRVPCRLRPVALRRPQGHLAQQQHRYLAQGDGHGRRTSGCGWRWRTFSTRTPMRSRC